MRSTYFAPDSGKFAQLSVSKSPANRELSTKDQIAAFFTPN
jgi:hypothetical protein